MRLSALSIVHPAGTKIANGQKKLEIRSWKPPTIPLLNLLVVENNRRLDREGDVDPDGRAVALIDITEVRAWTKDDALRDGHNFVEGYYAWLIANVRPIELSVAIPAKRLIYQVEIPTR